MGSLVERSSHLICFDFDHTLVDVNTDVWVYHIAPVLGVLPPSVKGSYENGFWLEYMGRIFAHLADLDVSRSSLQQHMAAAPWTQGMPQLIQQLRTACTAASSAPSRQAVSCAILSDSNTLFIEWILAGAGCTSVFPIVLSNHASWQAHAANGDGQQEEQGIVTVAPFHSHSCSRCNHNLCKLEALQRLIAQHRQLEQQDDGSSLMPRPRVIFVGDGKNDLCSALALGPQDVLMVRRGFPLDTILSARPGGISGRRACDPSEPFAGSSAKGLVPTPSAVRADVCSTAAPCKSDVPPSSASISRGTVSPAVVQCLAAPRATACQAALAQAAIGVTAEVVQWDTGSDILRWLTDNQVLPSV